MVRGRFLQTLLSTTVVLLVLLVLRVLAGIVYEYQWYFPADFQASGFLAGRERFFSGVYKIAFYSHIVCGPFVILIGMFLYWSGNRNHRIAIHRLLGKLQFFLVILILTPSGLVMATRAYTGYIAGAGFALLSLATSVTAIFAVAHARSGKLMQHRRWASRLLLLLLSPILLRLMSGAAITLGVESPESYQFSAWASWLIPLLTYEIGLRTRSFNVNKKIKPSQEPSPIAGNHLENLT